MSRTLTAITVGTFRLLHVKQTGDVIALRRLSERHGHELRTQAQWELMLRTVRS